MSKWKKEFEWLEDNPDIKKVVNYLVAHAGYSETQEKIKGMIRSTGIEEKRVENVWFSLQKMKIVEWKGGPFPWVLRIVTVEGSPYKRRY